MLHASILALRLAERAGDPFPRRVYDRLATCGEFLYELMEPTTGQLPLYGNNDGACVLPLNECDFLDYRPVLQATHYLVKRQRLLPRGAWDEDLVWLFGTEAVEDAVQTAPARQQSRAFQAGGYYVIRNQDSFAMIRCHTYKDRPAQCDQLHVDVWFRDQNIVQDCGTYQYYVPDRPELEYYFKSIRAHNTVEVDGSNPLELFSRFLWLPWPRGCLRDLRLGTGSLQCVEVEHWDYDRSPWRTIHRRTLIGFPRGLWVVVDDLIGSRTHASKLRWHLLDAPYDLNPRGDTLVLHTPQGDYSIVSAVHPGPRSRMQVTRGSLDPGHLAGLRSAYYGRIDPIPTLEIECVAVLPHRFLTVLGPGGPARLEQADVSGKLQRWSVSFEDRQYHLDLHAPVKDCARTLELVSLSDPKAACGRNQQASGGGRQPTGPAG
jgi:hypothetical protein